MFDIKSYYPAYSVREALLLAKKHEGARFIAGGTDLLIKLREGKFSDALLIGVGGIPELSEIALDTVNGRERVLCVGPLCTFARLAADPLIESCAPMLGRAVDQAGGPQLRNVGTIGGNVCNGATSADSAASLFALNARLVLASLPEGEAGREGDTVDEEISIHDFYRGPGRVALKPGQLLTEIRIYPEDYEGYFGHYTKYSMRNAMDIATLGCAVWCRFSRDLKLVEDVRLAYGVAGPVPRHGRDLPVFGEPGPGRNQPPGFLAGLPGIPAAAGGRAGLPGNCPGLYSSPGSKGKRRSQDQAGAAGA